MNIGWIDFSDSDRKKSMDILSLFHEQGAVDELGIGVIRDAFANLFFPGTSTIQTRAKYFFVVPYAMMEVVADPHITSLSNALRKLDEIERDTAIILKENSEDVGIIGTSFLPQKWVKRPPSTIYWSGIRRFGIFDSGSSHNMTIPEYFRTSLKLRDDKNSAKSSGNKVKTSEDIEIDDNDAGDFTFKNFWRLQYKNNWRKSLTIQLTKQEADFLTSKIKRSCRDSILAFLLRENIDVEQFDSYLSFSSYLKEFVDKENAYALTLADRFSKFISLAQVLYNRILSDGKNEKANYEWEQRAPWAMRYSRELDINAIFSNPKLGLNKYSNRRLKFFLERFQSAIISGDESEACKAIIDREVSLKGVSRAKLKNRSKYSTDSWIGGLGLDYRFMDAKRLIMDIKNAGGAHV